MYTAGKTYVIHLKARAPGKKKFVTPYTASAIMENKEKKMMTIPLKRRLTTARAILTTALAILFVSGVFAFPVFASDTVSWPGDGSVSTYDNETAVFDFNSSGLDFADGKLYVCDNGLAAVWVLDVAKDGSLAMSSLTSKYPKYILFADGADGPDSEGITVDGEGYVYLAVERGSIEGNNMILKADLNADGIEIPALQEWHLDSTLPEVDSNKGIEAIEYVPFSELEGRLFDAAKNAPLKASNYPYAVAGGVFFVGLEDNGHVYAYVLYSDGSSTQIADLDTGMGKVMSLDYDTAYRLLWAKTDDGCSNISAQLEFNGTQVPGVTYVDPPSGLDPALNYEGFAIASADYAVNGKRPVYFVCDGPKKGVLKIGSLDYSAPLSVTYILAFDPAGGTPCSPVSATAGDQIILPSSAKSGYRFIGWTDGTAEYRAGDSYTVAADAVLTAVWEKIEYKDVPSGSWYSAAAVWCGENGLITGTGGGRFSPDMTLTRAMFVQILARLDIGNELDDYKYNGRFSDVRSSDWFSGAVQWAIDNGVTGGTSATAFSPKSPVSREQIAVFFRAYASSKGGDLSAGADLKKYTDAGQISAWAVNAVKWAVAEKLISGTSDSTLSPKTNATRAQAAVIFKSFVEKYIAKQTS